MIGDADVGLAGQQPPCLRIYNRTGNNGGCSCCSSYFGQTIFRWSGCLHRRRWDRWRSIGCLTCPQEVTVAVDPVGAGSSFVSCRTLTVCISGRERPCSPRNPRYQQRWFVLHCRRFRIRLRSGCALACCRRHQLVGEDCGHRSIRRRTSPNEKGRAGCRRQERQCVGKSFEAAEDSGREGIEACQNPQLYEQALVLTNDHGCKTVSLIRFDGKSP